MTTSAQDAAALDLDVTGRVRAAQVEGLYAKLPVAVLASLPVGSAAAWSLWSANHHAWLLAWLVVMVGMVSLRLLQWRAYAAAGAARHLAPDRWARRSAVGSFASGLVWSAGLLLFMPSAPVPDRLFVVVLLAGMLAGSAGTLSDHLPAFLAFGIPMVVPIVFVLAGSSNALERLLVPFSLVYFTVITWVAHSSGRRLRTALEMRFRNEALVGHLTSAQERLTALNAELEQRVQERGDALAQAERQLSQAALLASVGSLATSVAHEINSPVACILSNVVFLKEELGNQAADLAACQDALLDAGRAGEQVREIVRSLTAVARADMAGEAVSLRDVLEACAVVAAGEIRPRALLVRRLGDVPPVRGDTPGLAQVFLQLIIEAARAVPAGGPAGHEVLLRSAWDAADGSVLVEISGQAGSAAGRLLAEAGDSAGQPNGFDMQLSTEVVSRLGGRITVQAVPGAGLRFTVRLPAAVQAPANGPATVTPISALPAR